MHLSKAQILQSIKPREDVFPLGGGLVRIVEMSAERRVEWENAFAEREGHPFDTMEFYAGLVARAILDDSGDQLFTTQEVAKWPKSVIDEIKAVVDSVNGTGAEAIKKAEGKSDPTPASNGGGQSLGVSGTLTPT